MPTPGWLTLGVDSLMLAPPMFMKPTGALSLPIDCPDAGIALRSLVRIAIPAERNVARVQACSRRNLLHKS
jgi:hypothetical protein